MSLFDYQLDGVVLVPPVNLLGPQYRRCIALWRFGLEKGSRRTYVCGIISLSLIQQCILASLVNTHCKPLIERSEDLTTQSTDPVWILGWYKRFEHLLLYYLMSTGNGYNYGKSSTCLFSCE